MRLRSIIFQTVFFAWGGLVCLIWLPVLYMPRAPRRWVVFFQTFWSRSIRFLLRYVLGLKMEVRGGENISKNPVIYAMKHQSMLDTFIMHSILDDPTFVMKKELLKIPLYGRLCKKVGNIAIDRDLGNRSMKELLQRSRQEVSIGRSVIIFPEGSRALPGDSHPYLTGAFGIYKHLKIPVVPVAVNTGSFWPKEGHLKQGTFVIEFLPSISPGLLKAEFMRQLEETIEKSCNDLLTETLEKTA